MLSGKFLKILAQVLSGVKNQKKSSRTFFYYIYKYNKNLKTLSLLLRMTSLPSHVIYLFKFSIGLIILINSYMRTLQMYNTDYCRK